jgi:hypothetical protein
MNVPNDLVKISDAQGTLRVTAAECLAKAFIIGVECCEEEGHPLTQLQQISMLRNVIMNYDEALIGVGLMVVRLDPQSIRARFGEPRPAG